MSFTFAKMDVAVLAFAMLLALPLMLAQVWRVISSLDAQSVVPALCGALLGVLAMDGLTGLVHWACDTWGDENTPWIGPSLVRSFREHHRDPRNMLAHDWTEVNREPALAAIAVLLALSLPAAQRTLSGLPFAGSFLSVFITYGAVANQLHWWAHADHVPTAVRRLQRAGLILSPERHAHHHHAPRTSGYCISTGWLNPVLDGVGFWRMLERVIFWLTGAQPRTAEPTERR